MRKAWKILYHSRAVDGHDIAVSGVVVAPTGPAPRRWTVVVTWAHGGVGLADMCAPSKQPDIVSGASGVRGRASRTWSSSLQTFLDVGDVIAATDYEGLGTPGLHPSTWAKAKDEVCTTVRRAPHVTLRPAAGSATRRSCSGFAGRPLSVVRRRARGVVRTGAARARRRRRGARHGNRDDVAGSRELGQ